MASIINVSWTQFQQIKGTTDNFITEYRDFATAGVPSSPTNFNIYLAKTSGSGFTIGHIYVYYSGTYYGTSPLHGYMFNDGINLYQPDEAGNILSLSSGIYNVMVDGPLDMKSTAINNVSALNAPAGQNSIPSSPITNSSYSVSNISSTSNGVVLTGATAASVSGFTATTSPLVGTINNTTSIFTPVANGNYTIWINATQTVSDASLLTIELSDATTSKVLGGSTSFSNGAGVGTLYSGFLASGDNIQARIISNIGTTVNFTLNVQRVS